MSATAILSVRVSPQEKAMLQEVAGQARSTVSDFMRRKALEAAQLELIERRVIALSPSDWETFEARMTAAPQVIPQVQELFRRPSLCTQ